MESLDTTELQSKLLDFTRTVQTCVILLVLYDLRKLSFNKNCPKNGWCSSNTPQKTNSLNCPAFMYSLDPAGRIWDCLKDMFPEAEKRSLKGWNWQTLRNGQLLRRLRSCAWKKPNWKIRPLIFFQKRFRFLDSVSVCHTICEICPIWVIFVGAIKHFSSQQGFDLRLIRHRWRFFLSCTPLFHATILYNDYSQSTPPLEKDVRRRLDLVGDSCSHLSKREQITVMGFDAIGQIKDVFSMKKCPKNSKVVYFHIYVVHCCYMNLSFHTDWWFLLVPGFFVHVSHLVSCCTCWHRTCRSMFRPSNNFLCKTIGGKDDLTWKALKFSELFCHQNDICNFIISEFV